MSNVVLTARLAPRELAIASVAMTCERATVAEVSRFACYLAVGHSPDEATRLALANRNAAFDHKSTTEKNISVTVPGDVIDELTEKYGFNKSTAYRYALARVHSDHDEAMEIATRKVGRPRKTQSK